MWKFHVRMTKKKYINNGSSLQNQFLTFIVKKYSLFSTTSVLSPSHMAYNTTASLEKLI